MLASSLVSSTRPRERPAPGGASLSPRKAHFGVSSKRRER
jgi:hypothetical protein